MQREKVIEIQKLKRSEAAQLFISLSRVLHPHDFEGILDLQTPVGTVDGKALMKQLEGHEFFEILNGHPQSIKLAAAML